MQDLSFVAHARHRRLLAELSAEAQTDERVCGVLLTGSLARGDAVPGSDIDLVLLLRDGKPAAFQAEERDGILIEYKCVDFAGACRELERQPMRVYSYLDGRIMADEAGRLAHLEMLARDQFDCYQTPVAERRAIAHWLRSALVKIVAARQARDVLKPAYVVGTTSWKILEGVWAAHNKPMPPTGAVWAHVADVTESSASLLPSLQRLFTGSNEERVGEAIALVKYVLPLLEPTA